MKEVLSEHNVTFAYQDITAGMGPLKQFLKLRDTHELYTEIRAANRVGIPTLLVDGAPYLVEDPEHMLRLIEKLRLQDEA